jgi:enamine deaminase RidA (YjgF/YER057c/UK114 family)
LKSAPPASFIAGQTALDKQGALMGRSAFPAQTDQVFRNLGAAFYAVGSAATNLVKLTVFLRSMDDRAADCEARNPFFATVAPSAAPAVALVEGSKLYGADFVFEIEAIAMA